MHLTSLRLPLLASISFSSLTACATAQEEALRPKPSGTASAAARAPAPPQRTGADDLLTGLPTFLLPVPGGTVEMGLDAAQFVAAASQVISQDKPAMAIRISPAKLTEVMRKSVSMLGRRKVDVAPFLLGKWHVKCSEYEAFVRQRRAQGHKVRAPFGWWRFGRKDDFEQRLDAIRTEFPKDREAVLLYWERNGHELPYALQDQDGKSIADHPVTYVSWREANEFAAWLGMRLPTEAEWTRAARGDGNNLWPLSPAGDAAKDVFSDELLKQLGIFGSRNQVLKPCGTVQAATGPFGHLDMFGQVWQLIADLGYRPIHNADVFAEEWKRLKKDKVGELLQAPPAWKDDRVIAKGGSYLSAGEPVTLLIDARAPMLPIDVLESVGVRLAKSIRPGYDFLYSSLRGTYHRGQFAPDQEVDLGSQTGAERYELGGDGFPTGYHALSFAAVNWLSAEKNIDLQKLGERSQTTPLLVGTMATTSALAGGVPAGIYSVLYRREGVPRELVDAVKQGHKELVALQKDKQKDDKQKDDAKAEGDGDKGEKNDKNRRTTWREIIARFGLTEQDVAGKEAADGRLAFVRVDGLEVPVANDCFLLHGNDGKVVAVLPATNAKPAIASPFAPTLVVEADEKGKAVGKLHLPVPLSQQNLKRIVEFKLNVTLDLAAPAADRPWRQNP